MQYVGSCRESLLLFAAQSEVAQQKNSHPKTSLYCSNKLFSSQRRLQLDSINQTTLKMPKRKGVVDPRERKAASKLARAPNVLSTSEAMLAAKFSNDEANNRTLQQRVWRLSKTIQTTNTNNNTSQVPSVVNDGNQSTTISDITDVSNPSSTTTSASISKPKVKRLRRTATQTQQHRSNSSAVQKHLNNPTKHATKWYAAEKKKKKQGKKVLSAEEVCKHVNKIYETNIHHKKIGNLVNKGFIGVTPPKLGTKGQIHEFAYKSIFQAFDSHIKINQFNGNAGENTRKKIASRLNIVIGKQQSEKLSFKLLDRILISTGCDILVAKCNTQEERRI